MFMKNDSHVSFLSEHHHHQQQQQQQYQLFSG
jgi:hypothetical protein